MSDDSRDPHSDSRGGRIWLAAMGVSLALAGVLFTGVLWRSYRRAMETRAWLETPCRIVSSIVLSERPTPHSPTAYRLAVRYEYEHQGGRFTGTQIRRVDGPSPHKDRIDELAVEYPAGRRALCHVNPRDPSQAILKQDSKAGLYSLWFPLLFVVGGAVMAWRAVRPRPARKR